MRQVRELSYTEELTKTKGLINAMLAKINEGGDDIDITEYLLAVTQLENKMKILKALSNPLTDADNKIQFKIEGTSREVSVDMTKLKDAITYLDKEVEEKQASAEDSMTKITHVDYAKMSEEEYVAKAIELIGEVQKNENKTLKKDSLLKIFKYAGDFAQMKQGSAKSEAQTKRMEFFDVDYKKYYTITSAAADEEKKVYDGAFETFFDKLNITQANFERSQQMLMEADPQAQMESFNIVLSWDKPNCKIPAELTREVTTDLLLKANDFGFDIIKKHYINQVAQNPMLMPLLISAIGHDWVFRHHN